MKQSADIVIIGGGVIGCSIAYHLCKRGVDVVVNAMNVFFSCGTIRTYISHQEKGREI